MQQSLTVMTTTHCLGHSGWNIQCAAPAWSMRWTTMICIGTNHAHTRTAMSTTCRHCPIRWSPPWFMSRYRQTGSAVFTSSSCLLRSCRIVLDSTRTLAIRHAWLCRTVAWTIRSNMGTFWNTRFRHLECFTIQFGWWCQQHAHGIIKGLFLLF